LFLFPIFSAIIASNKGKSATKWFFVGLLFGPFGLIVGFLNNENNKSTVNVKVKNIVEQESYYYEISNYPKLISKLVPYPMSIFST